MMDENVSEEEAFVAITLNEDTMVDIHIEHAIGSLERPMTREALEHKFSGQAASALPEDQIDRVMTLCWEIESLDDVGELANAAAAKS
jgi:hypothetical protein